MVTDAQYATLGRELAKALIEAAYERDVDTKKQVGALQHQLCQLWRTELTETKGATDGQEAQGKKEETSK